MGTGRDTGAAMVRLSHSSSSHPNVSNDDTTPIVYGNLVRLCGRDTEQAWDLTRTHGRRGGPARALARCPDARTSCFVNRVAPHLRYCEHVARSSQL